VSMAKRIHNIIFALLIGLVLGVTAYSVYSRLPAQVVSPAESRESSESSSKTERMIENGELSDHPAKYYRMLEQ
jgi:hypothetical protein